MLRPKGPMGKGKGLYQFVLHFCLCAPAWFLMRFLYGHCVRTLYGHCTDIVRTLYGHCVGHRKGSVQLLQGRYRVSSVRIATVGEGRPRHRHHHCGSERTWRVLRTSQSTATPIQHHGNATCEAHAAMTLAPHIRPSYLYRLRAC